MQALILRSPFLNRPWRNASVAIRLLSSESQARGRFPRCHSEKIPSSKGDVVRVEGAEFRRVTNVLRLGVDHRVEIFDGKGSYVEGCIQKVNQTGLDVMALEDRKVICPKGICWHVFTASGNLKGARADWLVEKCTELGARSVTPLLTQRSRTIPENQDRLCRVVRATVKQCQRTIGMFIHPPLEVHDLLRMISTSEHSFVAVAEATPVISLLVTPRVNDDKLTMGLIIVGPEEDFTEQEMKLITEAGAVPVGLGVGLGAPRLRSETTTITLLSDLMMWSGAERDN